MSAPLVQNSPEWEAARLATIGSSDIPAIVGEDPWKDKRTLAAEKLGLIGQNHDPETQLRLDIGHLMQPALLSIYQRISGRAVKAEHGWHVHPEIPWATASLDGKAPKRRVVEAKWTNSWDWHGEDLPARVQCQVQWQMYVVGWSVADVVVMVRGEPQVIEVPRDEVLIEDLRWHAERFREEHLMTGVLPMPNGSNASTALLKRMHPQDNGIMLNRTPIFEQLVAELKLAKAWVKEAEDMEATTANALRALLGDASGVEGLLTWRRNRDGVSINWESAFADLLDVLESKQQTEQIAWALACRDAHTRTTPGPRVLRLSAGRKT